MIHNIFLQHVQAPDSAFLNSTVPCYRHSVSEKRRKDEYKIKMEYLTDFFSYNYFDLPFNFTTLLSLSFLFHLRGTYPLNRRILAHFSGYYVQFVNLASSFVAGEMHCGIVDCVDCVVETSTKGLATSRKMVYVNIVLPMIL